MPEALVASPGTAIVTSVTGTGGGASNPRTFKIVLTTLKLTAASLTKNADGSFTAQITLKNTGYLAANNAVIKKSSMGGQPIITALPVSLAGISPGSTAAATLIFPPPCGSGAGSEFWAATRRSRHGRAAGETAVAATSLRSGQRIYESIVSGAVSAAGR